MGGRNGQFSAVDLNTINQRFASIFNFQLT
jgi:hypothetical protein